MYNSYNNEFLLNI